MLKRFHHEILLLLIWHFVKTASQQTVEQFVVLSFISCKVTISQKSSLHYSYKYTKIDLFNELFSWYYLVFDGRVVKVSKFHKVHFVVSTATTGWGLLQISLMAAI